MDVWIRDDDSRGTSETSLSESVACQCRTMRRRRGARKAYTTQHQNKAQTHSHNPKGPPNSPFQSHSRSLALIQFGAHLSPSLLPALAKVVIALSNRVSSVYYVLCCTSICCPLYVSARLYVLCAYICISLTHECHKRSNG